MERLRFSTRETKRVASVVQYHLRPTQLGEPPTGRAIYRYFRDAGDAGIDILYLSLADHLATRGPNLIPENWKRHADTIRYVLEEQSRKESLTPPVKLIDGNDLINLFGMKPGRELGRLLEAVREAQGAGELTSRQQALEYIHNALTGRGK
jgi:poly(A) polymerase